MNMGSRHGSDTGNVSDSGSSSASGSEFVIL